MKKFISLLLVAVFVFALCGCINVTISTNSSSSESSSNNESQGKEIDAYKIVCYKEDGHTPVEGVLIQFCTDKMCNQNPTDANGEVSFPASAGEWDVHVDSVPDGFALPKETALKTSATESTVTILIPAA